MRLWYIFRKSLKEQARDILTLALTLSFAPFFVLLYWLFFSGGSTSYDVLVLNNDVGIQATDNTLLVHGDSIVAAVETVAYPDGSPMLVVKNVASRGEAEPLLKDRDAEVLLIIPENFSRMIQTMVEGQDSAVSTVTFVGDLTNPYYAVAAIMTYTALEQYIQATTGQQSPIQLHEKALGASAVRTEFELYVPGLLVFAAILLVFLAAMNVAYEVESGTLRRLQITPMTSFELLGGTSASLVLIGVFSLVLTFITAWLLGFRSQGPLWIAILIGAVTTLPIIGVGLMVAAFSKTVTQAFLIANFPLGLFMFFSGAIFPIPQVTLFTFGNRAFGLYDILPPTHAVVALNKVLTLGADFSEISYEVTMLLVLSILYFAAGVWLFKRRHLRSW